MSGSVPDAPQFDIPPWPWPTRPPGWYLKTCQPGGAGCFGGTGTVWTFHASALRDRLIALSYGDQAVEDVLQLAGNAATLLSRWLTTGQECVPDDLNVPDPIILWLTPSSEDWIPPVGLYCVRLGIHGTLGTVEEVLHTFNLVKVRNGTDMSGLDAAALLSLADDVKTAWLGFLDTATGNGLSDNPGAYLSSDLTYDEVRLSLVEYMTAPTKAVTHVPTQYSAFTTPWNNNVSGPAPWEVAMAVTLLTDTKDRSARGRTYLGPFLNSVYQSGGLFQTAVRDDVGIGFGYNWIDEIHTSTDYDIVVASTRGHAGHQGGGTPTAPGAKGVGGVKVGLVPDAQRRRRKSQPEQAALKWGTAP